MGYVTHDGTVVNRETWGWVATYKDGSKHYQFDDESGEFHNFNSIDISNIDTLAMVDVNGKEESMQVPDGAEPVHYYDNIVSHQLGGPTVVNRIYCFGYKKGADETIFSIMPNGTIVNGVA